jgi:ubiquinone/menaquinone biosynthesis C-methylase UbiE
MLGTSNCRSLAVLDLGAGDGFLGKLLESWAAGRGWNWRVTNLDACLAALQLNLAAVNVAASAEVLPFRERSFDLVIASQMMHHLTTIEAAQLLRESWRVARRGILLCDLHRNPALYVLLWLLFKLGRFPGSFRADGLLSVRRGWRVAELRKLVDESGIPGVEVRLYFGARIVIQARKAALP